MMKKRVLLFTIVFIVLFLLYIVIGALVPFLSQPAVSQQTQETFSAADCYSDTLGPDRAALVEDNGDALRLRLQMIAQAEERIILSTFDFRTDAAGLDVLAALYAAAERGVTVEIFADGFNSILQMNGNEYFYALSSHPNARIIIYNQVNPLVPWKMLGRMHDKYLIVDEEAYLLGGRNTFGFFLGDYEGHKNYDREVLVYNAGTIDDSFNRSSLYDLVSYYEEITSTKYCHVFKERISISNRSSVQKAVSALMMRYASMEIDSVDYEKITLPTNKITLLSNPIHPYVKEPTVFWKLMELAEQSASTVRIHTPYIINNDVMNDAFTQIGSKTTILTNSAANNGNFFGAIDYLNHKQELIDTGITILEYEGGISYHGKSLTIDDQLAIVGSFNMDMRSTYIDTELMLVIHSPELNADLQAAMDVYEKDAATVQTVDSYSHIPSGMNMQELGSKKENFGKYLGWFLEIIRFVL